MNADAILPTIGPLSPQQTTVAVVVLVGVLVVGFLAGRAKNRFGALIGGLLVLAVVGVALTTLTGVPMADRPAWIGALLPLTVPLLIAFLAGWAGARASWFGRIAILVVAIVVLVAFPYAAVTEATARMLAGA